jgi:hypothetical protein
VAFLAGVSGSRPASGVLVALMAVVAGGAAEGVAGDRGVVTGRRELAFGPTFVLAFGLAFELAFELAFVLGVGWDCGGVLT